MLQGRSSYPNLDLTAIWGKRAEARGDTFVFSLMAFAQPFGFTVKYAYETLRDELLQDLKNSMPVDVVLLMLHGAMLAHGYDDCEQDVIGRIRDIVGPRAVIGVELDLHCHLSESKIAAADIVITYKEYPHVDINDRAAELFELAVRTKLGEIRPTRALFDCRMIGLYPTTRQPLRDFVNFMTEAERRSGVLSISFAHGFPFGDVPHAGAKLLVVTDNDPLLAQRIARELGLRVHGLRREIGFESVSLPMDAALTRALASENRLVVVADQSDNVGGGAAGDSTFALRWLLDHKVEEAAIAILYDPEVVRIAKKAGEGAMLAIRLGGKMGLSSGDPVDIEVTVLSVRCNYVHAFPQQSGSPWLSPAGDVAALRFKNIYVVVSSERCQCFSPSIFSDLGIDPKARRVLIAKSTQHFYGAFSRITDEVIYMAAPGAVSPDPRQFHYRRLDTERLYPWAEDPLQMQISRKTS